MKALLKKEMTLTAAPITYFFVAFAFMTLIPGYPIELGAFFVSMGIFYTFQFGREANDILFTALLPVKKSDVVRAKYAFTLIVELMAFAVCCILTALRMTVLRDAEPYAQNPLMNANLAYLGYLLIIFLLFNTVFLGGFFKTAYYFGKPFIIFSIVAMLAVGLFEALRFMPGLGWLASTDHADMPAQAVVLAACAVAFVCGSWLSARASEKRFEGIDL